MVTNFPHWRYYETLWWVHLGQQPSTHTAVGPSGGLQERTGRTKARRVMCSDKDSLTAERKQKRNQAIQRQSLITSHSLASL